MKTQHGAFCKISVLMAALFFCGLVGGCSFYSHSSEDDSTTARTDSVVIQPENADAESLDLKMMAWNIWRGQDADPQRFDRIVSLINHAAPDILCAVETYGRAAEIAEQCHFDHYTVYGGDMGNLAIFSRFPITDKIPVFKAFNSGAAEIQLPNNQKIVVCAVWLHYLPDYLKNIFTHTPEQLIEDEKKTRHAEIQQILKDLGTCISSADTTPVILAGDFNSPSHLDWGESCKDRNMGKVVRWPVSEAMEDAGFADVYREVYPDALMQLGWTWSPMYEVKHLDRIDYIYYRGKGVKATNAVVYGTVVQDKAFPSDHSAIMTTLTLIPPSPE
jgi:endonuclease/exonuclease/phosphatase (EEP) superfamily protein YafD